MMFDYTTAIIAALVVWEMIWKGFGTWRAGRNNQLNWFIAMFVLNTAGILPIIYLKFYLKFYQKKKR